MTKKEITEALAIAKSEQGLEGEDLSVFDGCAFKAYNKVYVTLAQVAKLFRHQALYLNGNWDSVELDGISSIAAKQFNIIG